jgi:hypothetical protein
MLKVLAILNGDLLFSMSPDPFKQKISFLILGGVFMAWCTCIKKKPKTQKTKNFRMFAKIPLERQLIITASCTHLGCAACASSDRLI